MPFFDFRFAPMGIICDVSLAITKDLDWTMRIPRAKVPHEPFKKATFNLVVLVKFGCTYVIHNNGDEGLRSLSCRLLQNLFKTHFLFDPSATIRSLTYSPENTSALLRQ
jgi:hypothetical protein